MTSTPSTKTSSAVPSTPGPPTQPQRSDPAPAASILARLRTQNPVPGETRRPRKVSLGLVVSLLVVGVLALAIVFPGLLAPYNPTAIDLDATLEPPTWAHLFGTDLSGRDLLSRVIFGARGSLAIGGGAVALATVLAVILGLAAGLSTRFAALLANRSIEILFAFPTVLLGLLLTSVFGPGRATLILAIGIGIAPGYARIVRGQMLSVRNAPYIEAATALGHSRSKILVKHIAPNSLRPMIVTVTLGIGQAIIWASGLAFLGLGIAPPAAEWGALLDAGRTYITVAWWLELFPGLVIVSVALAFTTIGHHFSIQTEGAR